MRSENNSTPDDCDSKEKWHIYPNIG